MSKRSASWTVNFNILIHAGLSAVDYTLYIILNNCCLSLYLNIGGLRKGPGKMFEGSC